MADTVTTRTLQNGPRNLIRRFTNVSDGTGESAVLKIDGTDVSLGYKGVALGIYSRIKRIDYIIRNGGLQVLWDATTDEEAFVLNGEGRLDFSKGNGVPVPAISGVTGSIRFTTLGFMPNSGYDVTIHLIKGVPQS